MTIPLVYSIHSLTARMFGLHESHEIVLEVASTMQTCDKLMELNTLSADPEHIRVASIKLCAKFY